MTKATWGLRFVMIAATALGAVWATALAAQQPFDSAHPSTSLGMTLSESKGQGRPRTVWDGVYTSAQAARGAVLFDKECAQCHGPSGAGGGMAPPLVGAAYSANYDGLTVGDLFDRNRNTMPPGKEGEIGSQENAEITAFMLQFNGFPPGEGELPSLGMSLKSIQYVATKPERPDQGERPPGTHQDGTTGTEWIQRLERPDRIPGLKIDEVIAKLGLKPGMTIADIGSGTGAFTIPFAKAVAPDGKALAVDIWPELLDHVRQKAATENVGNLQTVLAALDDPRLPPNQVDIAFFHDVFHNANDRPGYLRVLASQLKASGRIAIIEQEYDDPIAKKWDEDADRITKEQVKGWMAAVGFELEAEFDLFQGANNPKGTGMPERWFVIYGRARTQTR
jgi:predicted methyltransferase/mono/diheme cytochrome c family protein